jgi:hypothetical protein
MIATPALADCPRCGSAHEADDLRCPVCFLAIPPVARERDETVRVRIYRCASCGAAMEYQARAEGPGCVFCGSVLQLDPHADPVEQTEIELPFTVDRRTAVDVYRRWLTQQGFFHPSDLASAARLESLRALSWVGWVAQADALVTWTIDSDAGTQKARWAPHAGELQTTFEQVVIPATRGLSYAECARLIPTYDLASDAPTGRAGDDRAIVRERFEMPRSAARGFIVEQLQRLAEARIQSGQAPGTRFRHVHAAVHLRNLRTRRVAFPAYALAYRYRGRLWRTVISGQEPSCVIGEVPRSTAKVLLVLAVIIAGLAAAAIGLAAALHLHA